MINLLIIYLESVQAEGALEIMKMIEKTYKNDKKYTGVKNGNI